MKERKKGGRKGYSGNTGRTQGFDKVRWTEKKNHNLKDQAVVRLLQVTKNAKETITTKQTDNNLNESLQIC